MRLWVFAVFALMGPIGAFACGSRAGDVPLDAGPPNAIGSGARIRDITNPDAATHAAALSTVSVTGASVVITDTFDETKNGKSEGTVYVQDVGSQDPFSGVSLFSPSFVPQDLRVAPGDVVDLLGQYQENTQISTAMFPPGQVLPQISKPVTTFRFEYKAPTPTVIPASDLANYATGRKWISMLVTLNNVTLTGALTAEAASSGALDGRVTGTLDSGVIVTNELYDLQPTDLNQGAHFTSLTGVVTYFFDLHIAPRSAADWVP